MIRTPSCFVLNIANIVTSDYKLSGKKSHDYHACPPTIHFTIAICVRCPMKSKKVFTCLLSFLRWMCGINIVTEEISYWRVKIVQIMCLFEICMPTHLFDLMPNMLVHLPKKVELAGSVHNIWLCFLERYIKTLKSMVRQKYYPEGSLSKGYLAQKSLFYFGECS